MGEPTGRHVFCSNRAHFGNNALSSDLNRPGPLQKIQKKCARARYFLSRTGLLLSITAAVFACKLAAGDDDLDAAFGKDVLIIEASAFACHRFDIYLATSDQQRSRGLMFVRHLPASTGMLFVYENTRVISMWMKNTFIPLDMVFARLDGTVSSVAHHTEPQSLRSVASIEPVSFVLELNAGTARRLFIDEDSRLIWEPTNGDDE